MQGKTQGNDGPQIFTRLKGPVRATNEGFAWPSSFQMKTSPQASIELRPRGARLKNGLYTVNGNVWLPDEAHDMNRRVLVLSNGRRAGQRGSDATGTIEKKRYIWSSLTEDCSTFVQDGAVCQHQVGHKSLVCWLVFCPVITPIFRSFLFLVHGAKHGWSAVRSTTQGKIFLVMLAFSLQPCPCK